MRFPWLAAVAVGAASLAAPAGARNLVEASLLAEPAAATPGVPFAAAVRLRVPSGWHLSWINPGDAGLAPSLRWDLPPSTTAGPIDFPAPERLPQGPLTAFGLTGEVWLLVQLRPAPAPTPPAAGALLHLSADAEWLVCSDVCIPERESLLLDLPLGADAGPGPEAAGFAAARQRLPRRPGFGARLLPPREDGRLLVLRVAAGALPLPGATASFFPFAEGVIEPSAPQSLEPEEDGFSLVLVRSHRARVPPPAVAGVLVLRGAVEGDEVAALVSTPGASVPDAAATGGAGSAPDAAFGAAGSGLGLALLFAFLGGLLLNLMPCVLPVLAVKVLGFLRQAAEQRSSAPAHGLAFAAGVLTSFWALAGALALLRASGRELGWGFHLQSPVAVSLLTLLFFALGLSFLGLLDLGVGLQAAAGALRVSGRLPAAFASGVLATAVATPCTAPFMGAALGYAVAAPALPAFLVFTALGAGMALPFALLCSWPSLLRAVPRPGPWMEVLQQVLAFPLFATVLWLFDVLGAEAGLPGVRRALAGLLLVGAAVWLWRLTGRPEAPQRRRRLGGLAALLLTLAAVAVDSGGPPAVAPSGLASSEAPARSAVLWVGWSEERLARLVADRRLVFVDFTAAWCLTCQVNDRAVFSSAAVRERFEALGVVPMRADWTRADPAITRALAAFGRSGVPLAVLHGPAGREILPAVLTPGLVLQALDRAARPR